MFNVQKMMKQAQQVQLKLQELQEKFKDIEVTGESGAGAVVVTMTCSGDMRSITIDSGVMDDKETLEDLIVAATNNAVTAKDKRVEEETQKMMQEMGLPADAASGGLGGGLPF